MKTNNTSTSSASNTHDGQTDADTNRNQERDFRRHYDRNYSLLAKMVGISTPVVFKWEVCDAVVGDDIDENHYENLFAILVSLSDQLRQHPGISKRKFLVLVGKPFQTEHLVDLTYEFITDKDSQSPKIWIDFAQEG